MGWNSKPQVPHEQSITSQLPCRPTRPETVQIGNWPVRYWTGWASAYTPFVTAGLGALLVFVMRVTDVSIGSMRIVMLVRGRKWIAGVLGFFESLVWVLAAGLVLTNMDSPLRIIAFAAGFATGTVLGGTVEGWIAMGQSVLRVITPVNTPEIAPALRQAGFGVTVLNAEGRNGEVQLAFTVVPRRRNTEVLSIVHRLNPDAFVTLEDVSTPELRLMRSSRVRK